MALGRWPKPFTPAITKLNQTPGLAVRHCGRAMVGQAAADHNTRLSVPEEASVVITLFFCLSPTVIHHMSIYIYIYTHTQVQ